MDHQRGTIGGLELARWAVVALLIAVGVGLFLTIGRRTLPLVQPSVEEAAP